MENCGAGLQARSLMKGLLYAGCILPLLGFSRCSGSEGPGPAPNVNPDATAPGDDTLSVEDCGKCLLITEQAQSTILIVDTETGKTVWAWDPYAAKDLEDPDWFSNPDEAKPVYDNNYVLITASGGGVALVRISDKKTVFHAYAGGNPHSAELLPDGNIVTASSTGNYLTIFYTDTLASPADVYKKKAPIPSGHNVVWDKKRKTLWSAGEDKLYAYEYNFNCTRPGLRLTDSLQLPGSGAHDLFPVYGRDSLWLSNLKGVYYIGLENKSVTRAKVEYHENIKSVSSGPEGFPVIIIKPEEQWWSEKVLDTGGNIILEQNGARIYKARWFLPNLLGYPENHSFRTCR